MRGAYRLGAGVPMNNSFIICGTDTNVGKTVLSSLLMAAHDELYYWKPIQSGLEEETDSETVRRLSGVDNSRILPEAYKLQRPLSPHLSARLDGITLDRKNLQLPNERPLIVETAGGVLVPINDELLQIELIKRWNLPVLIASRTTLGTISHTLLTIKALRDHAIEIAGVVLLGVPNEENKKAIEQYGKVGVLATIPPMQTIDRATLREVYQNEFQLEALR